MNTREKLNFDSDIALALKLDDGTINAIDPNLKAFFARGGKLLQYHGWSDPQIAPGNSVAYYKSVLGGAKRSPVPTGSSWSRAGTIG